MQRRIFIDINLPQELKGGILDWQRKWQKLRFTPSGVEGIGWTKTNNFHITLVFIGEIEEHKVDKVLETARETAKNFKPFAVNVNRIHVGPNLNMPRMIWLSGPENKNLGSLARQLADNFQKAGIRLNDNHNFNLHITLARARNDELRGVKIEEKFDHSFMVKSIEAMESELSPNGPDYKVLENIKF